MKKFAILPTSNQLHINHQGLSKKNEEAYALPFLYDLTRKYFFHFIGTTLYFITYKILGGVLDHFQLKIAIFFQFFVQ